MARNQDRCQGLFPKGKGAVPVARIGNCDAAPHLPEFHLSKFTLCRLISGIFIDIKQLLDPIYDNRALSYIGWLLGAEAGEIAVRYMLLPVGISRILLTGDYLL